ncbi:MAG: HdeD family acid-resistance protein [Flavobacteriaceae bacterium]
METQLESFESTIKKTLKNWWVPLLTGILLIGTAIWTFASPLTSYLALAIIFSLSFLASGILEIYFSISNREHMSNWGWNLAFGVITALVGVIMLTNPEISMVTLPFYVGFVILFRSVIAIGWAIDLKNQGVLNWGNLMIMGVLGILFSFILLWNPVLGGMTIIFWTGFAILMSGIFSLLLSFKLRKTYKEMNS